MEVFTKSSSKNCLSRSFFQRPTITVARQLLGKKLVHIVNGKRRAGLIVETEAYLGHRDRAAHTYGGRRTARTETMYGEGGLAYVYFIYGMYFCLNVVTRTVGHPEAVLIRAVEPLEGLPQMRRARKFSKSKKDFALTSGPGKLCQAFGINRKQNGIDLCFGEKLFIEDAPVKMPAVKIVKGPRIGVDYAGDHAHWPLRFFVMGNPFVSI